MKIVILAILLAIIFLFGIGYRYYCLKQHGNIFQPKVEKKSHPIYRNIFFGENNHLHGWYFPAKKGNPTILFCHGSAGNIYYYDNYIIKLCLQLELGLFIYDYNGYGQSKGTADLNSIIQNGEDAYRWLRGKINPDQLILWGESLGGMVAIHLASKFPSARLLLMGTFADLSDLVKDAVDYPIINNLVYIYTRFQESSNLAKITSVKCPTLIIHSIEDEVIPFLHAERLYEEAKSVGMKIELVPIEGEHSRPKISVELFKELTGFLYRSVTANTVCRDILEDLAKKDKFN